MTDFIEFFFVPIYKRCFLVFGEFFNFLLEANKEKRTIRIKEDGLCSEIALCQTLYNYRYIHHIENHYGYLMIRVDTGLFFLIPHSAFQDDAHREAFEAALREKIKAYQAEPLSK